tara:strand:+ start:1115 stop:1282 length:168 start_codon:yes stop_codon:yes gene_type:complete
MKKIKRKNAMEAGEEENSRLKMVTWTRTGEKHRALSSSSFSGEKNYQRLEIGVVE